MSIFKRFSSKKSGDKTSESEVPLLDESADLTEDNSAPNIPASAEDAAPSLKGFSSEEREVIRSILSDEKTPSSNFHKTNRKTEAELPSLPKIKKTADDYLSEESFKTALNILKGDLDIETEFDDDNAPSESFEADLPEYMSISYDEDAEDTEIGAADETKHPDPSPEESAEPAEPIVTAEINYPERLVATATFMPAEKVEPEEIENKFHPEVEVEVESASIDTLVSGDEDMTSRDDSNPEREETFNLRRQADQRHDDVAHAQRRINLGEMRMDVANIISDIESGDSMYRRAQQRVETLTGFIERAEVDFSLLDRLEPENRALKSENITLNSELDKRKTRISQLTSSLEDLQRRYGDAQSELDATHSKLAQSIKSHEQAERNISELNTQMQEIRLKSDRTRNDLDVEARENGSLRGRIAEITGQLDKTTSAKLNLAKQIETLKIDVADQSENRLQLRDEVTELRHALEDAQRQNTQMRGEITGVHDDIRGFKTQYEFNILKRDERITDLESQIVELNDRLRVKEDQFETSSRELSVLRKERTAQDLERERLEKSVEHANSQLYRTEEELLKSRKTADELDIKYRDISTTLARTEERRQSSEPAQSPDITPPPFHTQSQNIETDDIAITARVDASRPETIASEKSFKDNAPSAERIAPTRQISDDIEDMLTDYKLGIRSSV